MQSKTSNRPTRQERPGAWRYQCSGHDTDASVTHEPRSLLPFYPPPQRLCLPPPGWQGRGRVRTHISPHTLECLVTRLDDGLAANPVRVWGELGGYLKVSADLVAAGVLSDKLLMFHRQTHGLGGGGEENVQEGIMLTRQVDLQAL